MQSDHCKNDFLDLFCGTFYWFLEDPSSWYQNTKSVLYNSASSWQLVGKHFSCLICQLLTGIWSQEPMLQWEDFITNKKNSRLLNKFMHLLLEQEHKRKLFKTFFPFSSLTKHQNHCCSHIVQHLLLQNCNAYWKQNNAEKLCVIMS